MQTDATRTCGLLVGLRDVTVLGVDERLRQPDEVCVDVQHHLIHRPIAIPEGSGAPFDAVTSKWGMPPKCRSRVSNNRERDRSKQRVRIAQNAEPKVSNCF